MAIAEIVKDPDFEQGAAWTLDVSGTARIRRGSLELVRADGSIEQVAGRSAELSRVYSYAITVASFDVGDIAISFGGVVFWSSDQGAGSFSGSLAPSTNAGLTMTVGSQAFEIIDRLANIQRVSRPLQFREATLTIASLSITRTANTILHIVRTSGSDEQVIIGRTF